MGPTPHDTEKRPMTLVSYDTEKRHMTRVSYDGEKRDTTLVSCDTVVVCHTKLVSHEASDSPFSPGDRGPKWRRCVLGKIFRNWQNFVLF